MENAFAVEPRRYARKLAHGKSHILRVSALECPDLDHGGILDRIDSEYRNGISVYSIVWNDADVFQRHLDIYCSQRVYVIILGVDSGIYLCILHPSPQSSVGIPLRSIFSVHIVAAYNILFPYAARFALDDPRNQQKEKINLARFFTAVKSNLSISSPVLPVGLFVDKNILHRHIEVHNMYIFYTSGGSNYVQNRS